MRPKIVILTLVAAFGVLGLIAVLKSVTRNNAGSGDEANKTTVAPAVDAGGTASNSAASIAAGNSKTVIVSEELRAALIQKEVESIQNLQDQVDGTNNPVVISALIEKFSHPEIEVRKAALEALRLMSDTNALPALEKVAEETKDPREKVAVMDAIDFIKMPSATDNVPPEFATNFPVRTSRPTNIIFNPNFLKGDKKLHQQPAAQSATPADVPATQPQ